MGIKVGGGQLVLPVPPDSVPSVARTMGLTRQLGVSLI